MTAPRIEFIDGRAYIRSEPVRVRWWRKDDKGNIVAHGDGEASHIEREATDEEVQRWRDER